MAYRVFLRTWWADKACRIPKAGRKTYQPGRYATPEEASAACERFGEDHPRMKLDKNGNWRGPRGLAYEWEEA
jgi:hypothetical protein